MSLFRARCAAYLRPSRLTAPVNARFISDNTRSGDKAVKTSPTDAPTTPHHRSDMISKETPSEAMARHQPYYNATVDHGTSYA
jgi:NADH dehydrogenase (ubiquinone) Fe-S protein 4